MLDEFEKIDKYVLEKKLDADIFSYLRSKMQHLSFLSFILAGRHRLEEMTPEFRNLIFNVAYHKEVGFLDADEAKRLITEPVQPYAVTFEEDCIKRILQLTAGHPYFIQQICHECIELLKKDKTSYKVTNNILDGALKTTLLHNSTLKSLWEEELDATDRLIISALATEIKEAGEWIKESRLLNVGRINKSELEQSIQKPVSQKLILRRLGQDKKNEYGFGVDMLRLWIQNLKNTIN
jgi:hypothetical protein